MTKRAKVAKPLKDDARELKDEATDKNLSQEARSQDAPKPRKRFGGESGFNQRYSGFYVRGASKAAWEGIFAPRDAAKVEIFRGIPW